MATDRKKGRSTRATIIWVDECGISLAPIVAKTWSPRGRTPVLQYSFRRKRLSCISGITRTGKLYFQAYENNINGERVIRFLVHLLRQTRRPIILIWDRGRIHRSKVVKEFLQCHPRIEAHYLPPYAPELNPDEDIWSQLKYHEMKNYTPADLQELKRTLRLAVMRVRVKPWLVKAFIHGCGLHSGSTGWTRART